MALFRRGGAQYAEKLVSKGKVEAAIREFKKLLAESGEDTNLLNRVGDLYVRLSKSEEAAEYYRRTAESYAIDGFYVKAIAVYKKIQRIEPGRPDVLRRLAELYERQGLRNDARLHYLQLAEQYLRDQDLTSAIEIHRRIVDLDPQNPSLRLKLAELLRQNGETKGAVAEYRQIAQAMLQHDRVDNAIQVYERAVEADPEDLGLLRAALAELRRAGGPAVAERLLDHAVTRNAGAEALRVELFTEESTAHLSPRERELLAAAAAESVDREPSRDAGWAAAREERDVALPEEWKDLSDLTDSGPLVVDLGPAEEPATLVRPPPDLVASDAADSAALLFDRDSGPRDVVRPPAVSRDAARPVGSVEESGEIDLTSSLLDGFDVAGAMEKPAADHPPAAASADVAAASAERPFASREEDLLSEAAVFLKYGLHRKAAERLDEVLELNPLNFEAHRRLVSVYLENGEDARALQAVRIALAASRQQDDDAAWRSVEAVLETAGYRFEGGQLVAEATISRPALSVDSFLEDDVAFEEPAHSRTQARPPGSAASGEPAAAWAKGLLDDTEAEESSVPWTKDLLEDDDSPEEPAVAWTKDLLEESGSADLLDVPPPAPAAPPVEAAGDDIVPPAAFEFPQEEESVFADAELLDGSSSPPAGSTWIEESGLQAGPELFEEERKFFDLAAELRGDLEEEELGPVPQTAPREQSLEEIVDGFRKGVAENISEEDADTHYNLGIAYREMRLLDEAIGEFQISAKDGRLRLDSCSMLGLCFLEKGQPELAVKWYEKALETENLEKQQRLGLLYDLGSAYESMEDRESAYRAFLEVCGLDDGFRDVADKVQQLHPS